MLEKTDGVTKNGQPKDMVNIGEKTQNKDEQNKIHRKVKR
jgi:hypothetical protein